MYTKVLLGVLITLIIIVYIYYYNSYKRDYNILQTYLTSVDLSLVYEKYPIVIYDSIINPEELTKTLFAYSYIFRNNKVHYGQTNPIYNSSKHLIIWCEQDSIINIVNPKYKEQFDWKKREGLKIATVPLSNIKNTSIQYVTVKLKKHQVIILPAFWIFTSSKSVKMIQLDDLLSIFS